MSKAQLVFNLPEEDSEFRLAINANKWYCSMWDLDQFLRSKLKYEELSEEEYQIYDAIRSKLFECLDDHSISFD